MNMQQGTNEGRSSTIGVGAGQPHRVGFASAEKAVCAAIQRTKYDVLCWHPKHASCHWVNGAISRMYEMRTASDFSHPYTPIRWH